MHASQRTSRSAIHKYPCFVAPSTFRHFSARTSHPFCTEFNTTVIYSTFNVQASMRSVCDCAPFSFSVIIISQIFTKVKISLSNFHLERICTFHRQPAIYWRKHRIKRSLPYKRLPIPPQVRFSTFVSILYLKFSKKSNLHFFSKFQLNPRFILKASPAIALFKDAIDTLIRN